MPRPRTDENVKVIAHRISRRLQSVGEDFLSLGRALQASMSARMVVAKAGGRRVRRARRALTPADRARLRLQGEYLGLVRHLSMRDRARVKVLRAKKGYPNAIKMARRLVKSRG